MIPWYYLVRYYYMNIRIYLKVTRAFNRHVFRSIFLNKGHLTFTINGKKCTIRDGVHDVEDISEQDDESA